MKLEAKARLSSSIASTEVTAAQHAQVKFKDGSVHKVSFYSDPNKRKGKFRIKSPGLPTILFKLEKGTYHAYKEKDGDVDAISRWNTKEADAKKAYLKGMGKFWRGSV